MNIFKSLFSRRASTDGDVSERAQATSPGAPTDVTAVQEYEPPAAAEDKFTNLVYQDHSGGKGGSDSSSKLSAIKLPDLRGKRFLDLGCNAGFFCAYAVEHDASYTLGIDNSDKVIAVAQERNPSLDFRGGGWDLFPDGEFDVVICLSAIHYAKDAVALAENIRKCLSPGGVFVLEGGLVGATDNLWTDVLIPVWRGVGDRCRHLSRGFVERHLLANYNWSVVGESVMQGGDPIRRFVIHALPDNGAAVNDRPNHRLCPLEYAAALALSAPTIHDHQPSRRYVHALAGGDIDGDRLGAVLGDDEDFGLFVKDLIFALNNHRTRIEIRASAGAAFTAMLASALEANGVSVTQAQ